MKYCPVCSTKYEDGVSFCAVDGEVLEDDPSTLVGTTLDGQYRVEDLLGKGGMGAVYRAHHILLGDRVAIKVLPPQMRNNAEWLRRFRREGQAARRFRHPNAVTVYDLRTTSEGLIYMVMEYVEGHTLDAELKARGRFTPHEALQVLEPVMSVLNAAHAMGVVHRDLKPENIMIGKADEAGESVVKLLDLGIAKMRDMAGADTGGATKLTVAGQILGTPYYMSPEQWGEVPRDMNAEIDGRADIYSLGTVFYELIAGHKPFNANSLAELRRQHINVMPKPLHEVAGDVPESFSRVIEHAMAKDRGDRPATAGQMNKELHEALGLPLMSSSSPSINISSTHVSQGAESSTTHTGEISEGRRTNADVAAPTVMTVDSAKPQGQNAGQSPAQPYSTPPPQSYPPPQTIATGQSVIGQPASAPSYAQSPPISQPAPRRSSAVIPIVAGVLLLLLVAGGVGVWFLMKGGRGASETTANGIRSKGADADSSANTDVNKGSDNTNASVGAAREGLSYWLEVAGVGRGAPSTRVAGVAPLISGQSFKFHLMPREDGYLYIIAPGSGNVPTTFLTAKPIPQSGVTTNQVRSGTDFTFPDGAGNWITLDRTPGSEVYTVIFSPTQLTQPGFLAQPAARALSSSEQSELDSFRNRYKANTAGTDVISGGGADPSVSVKIPQSKKPDEPVVFDVRVEHK